MAAFFKKVYNKLLGEEIDEENGEMLPDEEEKNDEIDEEDEVIEDMNEEKTVREPVANGRSIELKIAKLTTFDSSVMEVADHLISNRPVVLNLEEASKEAAKRIIDFFSGVTYTIRGQMKNISNGIYIATPSNVDVSNSTIRAEAPKASVPKTVAEKRQENTGASKPAASPYEGF